MKKTIPIIIITIFLFIIQNNYSQENFAQGYIINKQGDTIQGLIDYKNPKEIRFKNTNTKDINIHLSSDIQEFNINNNKYISAAINTNSNKVFLQTIFEGNKNLYLYKDFIGNTTFYIKQIEKFILLEKGKNNNSTNYNKYKGQLIYYLSDCSSIKNHIKKASYNSVSLSNVFKKYYECTQIKPSFVKDSKLKIEKGVFIGASSSALKFDDNDQFRHLNVKFKNSSDISAGLFLNIILSENPTSWSLNNEIQYYSYKTSNKYEYFESEDINTTITSKINHSFVKLNLLPRYKFPVSNKLSMYFNGGATLGFVLSEENYKKVEQKIYSNETIVTGKAMGESSNQEIGLIFGSGIEFNNLSIEARYEITNGATSRNANGSLNKFFLLVGYKI